MSFTALKLSAEELAAVMTFAESDPDENPWVAGKPRTEVIDVSEYDPTWMAVFIAEKIRLQTALGDTARDIVHVGSTAVPYLAAKPVIDIDLIVRDPAAESAYIPTLSALGYVHTVREPSWYQHRMLHLNNRNTGLRVNLHVFAPRCPEHLRHLLFRDWLIMHEADRLAYAEAKMQAVNGVNTMMDYNRNKHDVVQRIYADLFAALRA